MESVPSFITTFSSKRSDSYQDTRIEGRNDQSIQTLFDKRHNDQRQQEKLSTGRFTRSNFCVELFFSPIFQTTTGRVNANF